MPTSKSTYGTWGIALTNFLVQYQHALVAFVMSTVLVAYVGEQQLGVVVACASALIVVALLSVPTLFASFGTRHTLNALVFVQVATLLGLTIADSREVVIALYVLQALVSYALFIGIDLMVESATDDECNTGTIRGYLLTTTNIATLVATGSLALVAAGSNFDRTFVVGALALLPIAAFLFYLLPRVNYVGPARAALPLSVIKLVQSNRSLRAMMGAHFMLQLFFSWMVVYTPILLYTYAKLPWESIGIILAIAMLPYLLFEYPLGYIADKWLGEQEILVAGFVILAAATAAMAFMVSMPFVWWIVIMFTSRVGAAMVEVTTESHFFRQVSTADPAAIGAFRSLRPLANIVGPLMATILLISMPFTMLFVVFGVVLLAGVPIALSFTDSK